MTPQLKICPESVRALAELLRETDLSEIEYQVDSLRIRVVRSVASAVVPVSAPVLPAITEQVTVKEPAEQKQQDISKAPGAVLAKMVGTVYLSPGPGNPTFVKVGDSVTVGQTLFIIEAMKVMNMIKAEKSGVVKQVLVQDAQPVEYGEPIMVIE